MVKPALAGAAGERLGPRILPLYGGRFGLNVDEVPLLGSRDAPCVMLCRLRHTNYLRYQRSALPQLLLGPNLVFGALRNGEEVRRLLSAGCRLE